MKRTLLFALFLVCVAPPRVTAEETKPGRPIANETVESVFLATNLTFSAVNGVYLTRGDGSVWAAPLGLISGVGSLLYESGVNEGSGFVVATGFVSVAFGIVSLVKVDNKAKASKATGLNIVPVSGRASDGRWYGGVRASLRF